MFTKIPWRSRPKRTWSCLLIGALACLGCGRQGGKADCDAARKLIAKGALDEAVRMLDEIIADNPWHAQAVFYRGQAYENGGKSDLALAGYTDAIRINQEIMAARGDNRKAIQPRAVPLDTCLAEAHWRHGMLLHQFKDPNAAIKAFCEAIRFDGYSAEAYCGRGCAFLANGFPDLAFDDLTEAIRLKPKYAEALCQRARAAIMKGDATQAAEDCRLAIRANPNQARAYSVLGSAHSSSLTPDFKQAVACYEEAVRLDPTLAAEVNPSLSKTRFEWAIRLQQTGKEAEANVAVAQATALDPQYAALYAQHIANIDRVNRGPLSVTVMKPVVPDLKDPKAVELSQQGFSLLDQRQMDDAIKSFSEAIEIDPKYAELYYGRGVAFLEKGFPDTAIGDLSEAVHLDYVHTAALTAALVQRARAYAMTKDTYHAVEDTTRAIRLNPQLAPAYHCRATAYLKDGKFDRALADLNEAIRLNPGLALAYHDRATLYLKDGKFDRALADLNDAIRLNPGLAPAYHDRATLYLKDSEFDRAIADFNEAAALDAGLANAAKTPLAKAHCGRGLARLDNGELDAALADINEAASLGEGLSSEAKTRLAEAYRGRGLARLGNGEIEAALADLDEAIRLQPDWADQLRLPLAEGLRARELERAKSGEVKEAVSDPKH